MRPRWSGGRGAPPWLVAGGAAVLVACSAGGQGSSTSTPPAEAGADAGSTGGTAPAADAGATGASGPAGDAGTTASCREGASRCDHDAAQECAAGAWTTGESCANGCVATAIGAACRAVSVDHTEVLSGALSYEALVPNAQHTGWTPLPETFPARGFLVVSQMADPAHPGQVGVIDAAYTAGGDADAGRFQVRVRRASERAAEDQLLVLALADDGAGGIGYALADPQLEGGYQAKDIQAPVAWSWFMPVAADLVIGVDGGGAAAHVFSWLHRAEEHARGRFGRRGRSLIVFFGVGGWHVCGPCYFGAAVKALGTTFDRVITFPGNPTNQPYWSESQLVHEVGHWVLDSYGTLPQEGGTTWFMQHRTFPGQAWNEGWAEFFSHDVRGDPVSLVNEETAMYWLDLDQRIYFEGDHERAGFVWHRAAAADGLLQQMDPMEVAAMLWRLSQRGNASEPLYAALASPRMNAPPFRRGCTRHTWAWGGPNGETMIDVQDTGATLPCFPDFLDALVCAGFPGAAVDAVTEPAAYYPYPSDHPLCP